LQIIAVEVFAGAPVLFLVDINHVIVQPAAAAEMLSSRTACAFVG
jgi:hypothetical protein